MIKVNNTAFSNREKALIFLARNSLKRNQMLANDYYSKLYSIATSNSTLENVLLI